MQRIIYSLLILCFCLSCQVEGPKPYSEPKPSVYFVLEADKDDTGKPRINYSIEPIIARNISNVVADTVILNIPVRISGMPADRDRIFRVMLHSDATLSTAKEGIDYEKLPERYTFKAGQFTGYMPLKVYRTKALATETKIVALTIQESDDFTPGERLRRNIKVAYSDRLEKPSNWISQYKIYNRVRHRAFLEITGLTEFPNSQEMNARRDYFYNIVPRALYNYFNVFPRFRDENGEVIEP